VPFGQQLVRVQKDGEIKSIPDIGVTHTLDCWKGRKSREIGENEGIQKKLIIIT
jgi:hypothetical protein